MKNILLCLISFSFLIADIHISGDARVRPRYDIKENGDNSSTSDFYYLYRARLNLKADIDNGWFFKTQLGTNSVAGMTKMGTLNGEESYTFNPSISFMELYFGYMDEKCGFWAGAFPLKNNPGLDLHFYSDKLVDIPFILFNNGSITGFSGYRVLMGQKINWFLSVDNNVTNHEETIEEIIDVTTPASCSDLSFLTQEACEDAGYDWTEETIVQETIPASENILDDYYTLGFDVPLTIGSVSITPRFLISMGGDDQDIFPTSMGADIKLPEVLGFSSGLSYYMSTYGKTSDEDYYEADHLRLSFSRPIKDGKLKFFYDMATKNDDEVSFMWLSYTHTCYKGEMGSVTISPTFRLQNGKNAGTDAFDADYSRSKFEITTQIKFK